MHDDGLIAIWDRSPKTVTAYLFGALAVRHADKPRDGCPPCQPVRNDRFLDSTRAHRKTCPNDAAPPINRAASGGRECLAAVHLCSVSKRVCSRACNVAVGNRLCPLVPRRHRYLPPGTAKGGRSAMHSNMTRRQLMRRLALAAPVAVVSSRTSGAEAGSASRFPA